MKQIIQPQVAKSWVFFKKTKMNIAIGNWHFFKTWSEAKYPNKPRYITSKKVFFNFANDVLHEFQLG